MPASEIFFDGFRLGRRFDDNELHEMSFFTYVRGMVMGRQASNVPPCVNCIRSRSAIKNPGIPDTRLGSPLQAKDVCTVLPQHQHCKSEEHGRKA